MARIPGSLYRNITAIHLFCGNNYFAVVEVFTLKEKEILSRLSVGDPAALDTLIRSYYAVLCRFAEKFLPDASLAKDVVQESYIKLWKSGKSFDSIQALKAYLYAITRNGCLDMIRNRSRLDNRHQQATANIEEAIEPVLTEIIRAESVALIYQAVKGMPAKMQQVFILSYREGMTVSEIAAHLGMNLKAVKKQKYKALVALRGRFAKRREPLLSLLTTVVLMGDYRL
jgi:RNA polymerase sigma-70 factor (ECF subfamily)